MGITLSNLWGESLDQANNTSSRSGDQVETSSDGKIYYVVSHQDLGVPNWLDTADHRNGLLTYRWFWPKSDPTRLLTRDVA